MWLTRLEFAETPIFIYVEKRIESRETLTFPFKKIAHDHSKRKNAGTQRDKVIDWLVWTCPYTRQTNKNVARRLVERHPKGYYVYLGVHTSTMECITFQHPWKKPHPSIHPFIPLEDLLLLFLDLSTFGHFALLLTKTIGVDTHTHTQVSLERLLD